MAPRNPRHKQRQTMQTAVRKNGGLGSLPGKGQPSKENPGPPMPGKTVRKAGHLKRQVAQNRRRAK